MNKQTILRRLFSLVLAACCLFSAATAETAEPLAYIKLSWEAQSIGEELDIMAYVTGVMDDGGDVLPGETEGEYYNSTDGSWIGSHYVYGNGFTYIGFNRLDGDYSIIVEWGNPDLLFSGFSYGQINLNMEISTPEDGLINISADPDRAAAEGRVNIVPIDDYYYRGATGAWYLGFRLDHGKIAPLIIEDSAAEAPDAPVIQEVQTQSVESYNAAGFKTASEWLENGVVAAYTYWDFDENNRLVQIRYANALDPDEVTILFTYENGLVQMYNIFGTLLAEAESAYAAAEQLGMGYIVAESGYY